MGLCNRVGDHSTSLGQSLRRRVKVVRINLFALLLYFPYSLVVPVVFSIDRAVRIDVLGHGANAGCDHDTLDGFPVSMFKISMKGGILTYAPVFLELDNTPKVP